MLGFKIGICNLIEKLDEKECLKVIRSLRDELGCGNLNQLLIKLILQMKDTFTLDSLENIKTNIQHIIDSNRRLKQEQRHIEQKINVCNDTQDNNPIFPLLRLG